MNENDLARRALARLSPEDAYSVVCEYMTWGMLAYQSIIADPTRYREAFAALSKMDTDTVFTWYTDPARDIWGDIEAGDIATPDALVSMLKAYAPEQEYFLVSWLCEAFFTIHQQEHNGYQTRLERVAKADLDRAFAQWNRENDIKESEG